MEFQCSVCTDDMLKSNLVIVSANCGHIYHKSCLCSWLSTHSTCPECRSHCDLTKFHKVFLKTKEIQSELVNNLLSEIAKKDKKIEKLNTYLCDNVSEIEKLECIKSSLQEGLLIRDAKIAKMSKELKQYASNKENTFSTTMVSKVGTKTVPKDSKTAISDTKTVKSSAIEKVGRLSSKTTATGTIPKSTAPKIASKSTKVPRISLVARSQAWMAPGSSRVPTVTSTITSSTSSSSSSLNKVSISKPIFTEKMHIH